MDNDASFWKRTVVRLGRIVRDAIVGPSRSLERRHLPILGTYFGYGAIGLTAVAEASWIRKELTLTPADLASLSLFLGVPWSVKMLFGLLVDSATIFGSARRSWLLAGSALMAAGLLLHAANAGGHMLLGDRNLQWVIASMLIVVATVLQDVVADALTSEVVPRIEQDGSPRPQQAIVQEMAMLQVMGRFALAAGLVPAGLVGGWLAGHFSAASVYLVGLVIPCVTATCAILGTLPEVRRRPMDWLMLLGGAATAGVILVSRLAPDFAAQELIFVVSIAIAAFLLWRVARELDPSAQRTALSIAALVFILRATPSIGEAYRWYTIDVLMFDDGFFSQLAQLHAVSGLLSLWLASRAIARNNQTRVLLVIILIDPLFSLLTVGPIFGLHHWTQQLFGVGARELALLDTWLSIRVSNLGMVAMLTLAAFFAPPGRTATWFALMASIMNLGLVAGQLQSKYLGMLILVDRSDLSRLPELAVAALVLGTIVPWIAVAVLGRRLV